MIGEGLKSACSRMFSAEGFFTSLSDLVEKEANRGFVMEQAESRLTCIARFLRELLKHLSTNLKVKQFCSFKKKTLGRNCFNDMRNWAIQLIFSHLAAFRLSYCSINMGMLQFVMRLCSAPFPSRAVNRAWLRSVATPWRRLCLVFTPSPWRIQFQKTSSECFNS